MANVKSYADFDKLGFDRMHQEMMADMYRQVIFFNFNYYLIGISIPYPFHVFILKNMFKEFFST